jgi:hypothetical protein
MVTIKLFKLHSLKTILDIFNIRMECASIMIQQMKGENKFNFKNKIRIESKYNFQTSLFDENLQLGRSRSVASMDPIFLLISLLHYSLKFRVDENFASFSQ